MKELDLVHVDQWLLTQHDHPFLRINKSTIIYTWITLGLIALLLILCRYFLRKKHSVGRFLTLSFVQFFIDLIGQTSTFSFGNFVFITTTFCFVLACNIVSVIPWMEEPTTDLNTTLALGLVSFFYTQIAAIKVHGLWNYLKGFFSPVFLMFPLNVIGKLGAVVSISFRLFGNIFGGSIISTIYFSAIKGKLFWEILGLATGVNLLIVLFFGVFEGCLQAFVFAMLSQTYLSIAISQEEGY